MCHTCLPHVTSHVQTPTSQSSSSSSTANIRPVLRLCASGSTRQEPGRLRPPALRSLADPLGWLPVSVTVTASHPDTLLRGGHAVGPSDPQSLPRMHATVPDFPRYWRKLRLLRPSSASGRSDEERCSPHGPQEQAGPRRWPFSSPDTYGHRDTCNHSRNDTMPSLRVFLIMAELHGHAPVAGFAPRSPYPSLRLAPGAACRRARPGRARPSAVNTEPPARPVLDEKLKQETPSPREPCVWRWPPLLKKAQSALEGVTRRGPCRRLRTFPPRLEGTQCSQRCPAAWPLRRRGSEHGGASCCTSGLTPPQS